MYTSCNAALRAAFSASSCRTLFGPSALINKFELILYVQYKPLRGLRCVAYGRFAFTALTTYGLSATYTYKTQFS